MRLLGHLQPFSSWGQRLRPTVPWVPLLSSVLHIKPTQQLKKGSCDSPTLLMRKLRLREVKDLSGVTGRAETGLQPRPPSDSTAADAALFSASGISDPAGLPEHSPAPVLVPSLQSRLRWPRASPEDGGLSPPPWTLFLYQHHPPSHRLFQQPHPCQLTWNLQLSFSRSC